MVTIVAISYIISWHGKQVTFDLKYENSSFEEERNFFFNNACIYGCKYYSLRCWGTNIEKGLKLLEFTVYNL